MYTPGSKILPMSTAEYHLGFIALHCKRAEITTNRHLGSIKWLFKTPEKSVVHLLLTAYIRRRVKSDPIGYLAQLIRNAASRFSTTSPI